MIFYRKGASYSGGGFCGIDPHGLGPHPSPYAVRCGTPPAL